MDLDLAAVAAAQDRIAAWLAAEGVSAPVAYRVRLVLEELLANLVLHGRFDGDPAPAEVSIALEEGGVAILLADAAAPFDPRAAPEPPAPSLEGEAVGGLGLALVRRMAELRGYGRAEDGRNMTRLWIGAEAARHG